MQINCFCTATCTNFIFSFAEYCMIAQEGNVQSQSVLEIKPITNGYRYPCKPAGYQNKRFGAVSVLSDKSGCNACQSFANFTPFPCLQIKVAFGIEILSNCSQCRLWLINSGFFHFKIVCK